MVNYFGPGGELLGPSKQAESKTSSSQGGGGGIKFEKGSSSESMFSKLNDEIVCLIKHECPTFYTAPLQPFSRLLKKR